MLAVVVRTAGWMVTSVSHRRRSHSHPRRDVRRLYDRFRRGTITELDRARVRIREHATGKRSSRWLRSIIGAALV